MVRVFCIVIGYVFGLFETGVLVGKLNGIDIRQKGSGNSGATNALRVMGKKAGLLVFAGDLCKAWLAILVSLLLFGRGQEPAFRQLLTLYAGLGTALGHNFPFYLNFKGGKGIAVTGAVFLAADWRVACIALALFALTVYLSHYVSLGSIVGITSAFLLWCLFGAAGLLKVSGSSHFLESCLVTLALALLGTWMHRGNIKRLKEGTENKIF